MIGEKIMAEKFLMYKNRPLVRQGNTLYYGRMADPYVVMMQITSSKKEGDLDMASKVIVQLMSTDTTLDPKDMFIKRSEKEGLYPALDIASIWLDRYVK